MQLRIRWHRMNWVLLPAKWLLEQAPLALVKQAVVHLKSVFNFGVITSGCSRGESGTPSGCSFARCIRCHRPRIICARTLSGCGSRTPRLQLETHVGGSPSWHRRNEHPGVTWLRMVPTTRCCLALKLIEQAKKLHWRHVDHHPVDCALGYCATSALRIGICCIYQVSLGFLFLT